MKFLRLYIGSTKKWMIAFFLLGVAGIFSPTGWTGWWHIRHPSIVACRTFSARIPFAWTGSDETNTTLICEDGFSLIKWGPTIFGSGDNGSALSITPGSDKDLGEKIFRQVHHGAPTVSYKSDSTFQNCILTEEQVEGRKFVEVFCSDKARGINLRFSGSRHALPEALNLIR